MYILQALPTALSFLAIRSKLSFHLRASNFTTVTISPHRTSFLLPNSAIRVIPLSYFQSTPMSTGISTSSAVLAPSYADAKFYYSPGSCAVSCFVAAHVAGLKGLQVEQVDLRSHITKATNADFFSINPKGNVPTLTLPGGVVLNECSAVLQYIADQAPNAKLAAPAGTVERYLVQNALNWVATELHTRVGVMFSADTEEKKKFLGERAQQKLQWLDKVIEGKNYYLFDRFTVVDAYLYAVLNWVNSLDKQGKLSWKDYPNVLQYYQHIIALPTVQAAAQALVANPSKL